MVDKKILQPARKKDEKIELWKRRIRVAKKINEENFKDHPKFIKYYEGHQWWNEDVPMLEDRTTVNLIFANIKKELPSLYFQNPAPIVTAKRQEFELHAEVAQNLLRYYTKENLDVALKKQIRLAILDAKFAPYACCKVIYTPLFETNPKAGDPIFLGYDYFGEALFLTDKEGNFVGETNDILVSELYYIERIPPQDMLIDPECKNFDERAKWIGQKILKPVEYLKKSKLYKNTANLKANVDLEELYKGYTDKEVRMLEEDRYLFYEIYDLEHEELLVFGEGETKFFRQEKQVMNPFTFLKFNEIPDKFAGIPDVQIEKPLQDEINVGRSQMITHARRASRKYYYEENTIDEDEIDKAKEPEDMTFFAIKDIRKPPEPLALAAQDPSIFQNLMQSRIDFNEVSSQTESERGVTERRKTFGEAKFIEGHAATRKADKQSLVADFIKEIYSKLLQFMQKTLTIEQAIKVVGPEGMFWANIKRDDIIGEFFVDVEVSELRPQIPEIEKQELAEFMFALANLLNSVVQNPLMFQILNVQGLIKELAKPYTTLKVENILNMAVTAEQIAQQAMEMQQQKGGQRTEQGAE